MRRFENIAILVRKKRYELGVGQTELAKMAGFKNGQFISNLERGLCGIPPKKIARFSIILDLQVDELIEKIILDERNFLKKMAFGCPEAAQTRKDYLEEKCQKTTQQAKPVLFAMPEQKEETVTTTFTQEKPIQNTPTRLGTLSPLVETAINNFFTQNL
jgi:transcriptional regulator with XRE-family HTH domain